MGDGNCVFRTLMTKSVPHILEKIFLSLDYESFKNCFEVCEAWCDLLRTESFKKRAKYVYQKEISFDEAKLHDETFRLDIDFYPDFKLSKLDIDQIKRILSPGLVDVNSFNLEGMTPLLSAAFWGIRALVQVLLDGGADPDKADENGWTPLYVATQGNNIEVVKLLIECGADINRTDNKTRDGLHYMWLHFMVNVASTLCFWTEAQTKTWQIRLEELHFHIIVLAGVSGCPATISRLKLILAHFGLGEQTESTRDASQDYCQLGNQVKKHSLIDILLLISVQIFV